MRKISIDASSLQLILDEIIAVGAKMAVIADNSGLTICTSTKILNEEKEQAMAALASLVIPTVETIAHEVEGVFQNSTIRTTTDTVLAQLIPSEPPVSLMVIVESHFEAQVLHELADRKMAIMNAMQGIAGEIHATAKHQSPKTINRVERFFTTLKSQVEDVSNTESLVRILFNSKEDFLQIKGSWTTIAYHMNKFASKIRSRAKDPEFGNLDLMKRETIQEIEKWKNKVLGIIPEPEKPEDSEEKEE